MAKRTGGRSSGPRRGRRRHRSNGDEDGADGSRPVGRRRFVGFLGATGIAAGAGCLGDEEVEELDEPADDTANDDDSSIPEEPEFEFPNGADASGVVPETIVSGARDVLASAGRYRIVQHLEVEPASGASQRSTTSYEVSEDGFLEHQAREEVAIDRWVTPERTVGRSAEVDGDRSGAWASDTWLPGGTGRDFRLYPFETLAVPSLLAGGSYDFDEIVPGYEHIHPAEADDETEADDANGDDANGDDANGDDGGDDGDDGDDDGEVHHDDDREYARYEGVFDRSSQATLPRWTDARFAHVFDRVTTGTVSFLVDEDGGLRAFEFELEGQLVTVEHDSREASSATVRGTVAIEHDGLEELTAPDWGDPDDQDGVHEFGVRVLGGPGPIFELASGDALPGWTERRYAEFYVAASFGDERYVGRLTRQDEFEVGDRLYVGLDGDELVVSPSAVSGINALKEADRVDLAVHSFDPSDGRVPIYVAEVYP